MEDELSVNDIKIDAEFVTLGQLLKITDAISSGGIAKWFLQENVVYVNGEDENRSGRKLRHGDVINIAGCGRFRIIAEQSGE